MCVPKKCFFTYQFQPQIVILVSFKNVLFHFSGVKVSTYSAKPSFVVDKPFLFKIVYKRSDATIFIGTISDPMANEV